MTRTDPGSTSAVETAEPVAFTRRTVVRAAAWTAPVASMVATAPAWAASTPGPTVALARRSPATASARAFDPGQAQVVSVTLVDADDSTPAAGRTVTFSLGTPSATWLRLLDATGADQTTSTVVTDARGVASAPLRVAGLGATGSSATVVATSDDPGAAPLAWTFTPATSVLAPSGPVGVTGKFTGALAGGRAYAWGTEDGGQLGIGAGASTAYAPVAVSVAGASSLAGRAVVAMAVGDAHALAVTTDGVAHAWGRSTYGQLGLGATAEVTVPAAVSTAAGSSLAGRTVVAVAAGSFFSLALTSDGLVHSWGRNDGGQLGVVGVTERSVPGLVDAGASSSLAGRRIVAISAGNGHSLALDADGFVHAWGRNGSGILGRGTVGGTSSTPALVTTTTGTVAGVTAVVAGANFSLALAVDGAVHSWGINNAGQLGTAVGAQSATPVAVSTTGSSSLAGRSVVGITGGQRHALAVTGDGVLHSWGANNAGQLGWGGTTSQTVPGAVATAAPSSLAGRAVVMATGMRGTSHALAADGTFHSWGDDAAGERGDGAGVSSGGTPGLVTGIV